MRAKEKVWPIGEIYNRKTALDVRLWLYFGKYATFDGAEVYMKFGDSPAESALIPAEFVDEDIRLTMAWKWWKSQGASHRAMTGLYPMARIYISDEWGCSDSDFLTYWAKHKTFSGAEVYIWPIHLWAPCGDEDDETWEWHMYEKTREWLDPDWDSDDSHDGAWATWARKSNLGLHRI